MLLEHPLRVTFSVLLAMAGPSTVGVGRKGTLFLVTVSRLQGLFCKVYKDVAALRGDLEGDRTF